MTTHLATLLDQIGKLTDKEQLKAIACLVQSRLEELERDKGELHLILHNGEWYATTPPGSDGRRRLIAKLGPKLSPAAVLRQSREPAPKMEAFELHRTEAAQLKAVHPDQVGWWEDERRNRRYYNRPAYDEAKAAWRKLHELATHPLALVYGLSCRGVGKLLRLEAAGYQLVIADK